MCGLGWFLSKGCSAEDPLIRRRVLGDHEAGLRRIGVVYLRRHRRGSGGETYEYWTLVRSVRTSRGPRQETVAQLGKLPGLSDEVRVGW